MASTTNSSSSSSSSGGGGDSGAKCIADSCLFGGNGESIATTAAAPLHYRGGGARPGPPFSAALTTLQTKRHCGPANIHTANIPSYGRLIAIYFVK
jgi:hypothetical protein